jgi:hypothetical protein
MLPHAAAWPLPPSIASFASLDRCPLPTDADQIEKDLHRAGRLELGVADDDLEAHLTALRRVLRAWCHASNGQGYSQAMSRIAASLLVAADNDAEMAFLSFAWLMRTLPGDYYEGSTTGYRVDVRAMRILAAWRWPDVVVPALYEPVELVAGQWFLSLWATVLPLECCLSIWAQMIHEGADDGDGSAQVPDTSLRVALVLLDRSLDQLHDAATMDAADVAGSAAAASAEDEPAFAAQSYGVLQQVARWQSGESAALIAAARALALAPEEVAEARRLARSQLDAEAQRRAREKAAARAAREEAEQRERERAQRESDGRSTGTRTESRVAEEEHAAYAAEVAQARHAATREVRSHLGTDLESQLGDLRIARSDGTRRRAPSCPASGCGACAACIGALPLCLAAVAMWLSRFGRRIVAKCEDLLGSMRRKARRVAPLAGKEHRAEELASAGVEMSDVVAGPL